MPDEGRRWRLGFWSLIATQFQGAFNENGLKYFAIYLILSLHLGTAREDNLIFLISVLFAAPFILFSMLGGYFADRYSKRTVTIGTKYFEIVVVAFSAVVLLGFHSHPQASIPLLLSAIFLASTQAAIFGPSKYGLLPELLPERELSWGNGVIELGTFLAIILGTVAGSQLPEYFPGHEIRGAYFFLGCGMAGLLTAHFISKVPAADPVKKFRLNAFGDFFGHLRVAKSDRALWLAIVGNTYFFFLGALLQFNVVLYGERVLHASGTGSSKLQAAIAIGIGVGSFVAGSLSGGRIEDGLVPLGALGMTLFGFLLSAPNLTFLHILVLLAALGFSGGQRRCDCGREPTIVRRRGCSRRGAKIVLAIFASGAAGGLSVGFVRHAGRRKLSHLSAAGFVAATFAVDCDAHALPDSYEWCGERACARRGDAVPEPRVNGGRRIADCDH